MARKHIIWYTRARKRIQKEREREIGLKKAISDGWVLESTLKRKWIWLKSALSGMWGLKSSLERDKARKRIILYLRAKMRVLIAECIENNF